MSVDIQPAPLSPLPIHRLSVEQYHRMIQTGVLSENDPVELLEGLLVSKMPHSPTHDATVSILLRRIWTKLPGKWIVRVQSAITLDDSEPEPDLAVVLGPEERYLPAHPTPSEIALVIEVADTSLAHDRHTKARAYARARIPIYWIVNLVEQQVEVYEEPKGGRNPSYRQREDFGLQYGVPLVINDKELARFSVGRLFS